MPRLNPVVTPQEIAARARRIRLPHKELARLAGVDETTVERTLNRKTSPLYSTVSKLLTALEQEEARMLAELRHDERARRAVGDLFPGPS